MIPEGGIKHILVVDDDPDIRRFLSESLRLHGYAVHSCQDAKRAKEKRLVWENLQLKVKSVHSEAAYRAS